MKNNLKIIVPIFCLSLLVFILGSLFIPLSVSALEEGEPIVPCGRNGTGAGSSDCTFDHLFVLVNNIIDFTLFYLALPIAGLVIAIAGAQMVIYAGNDGKRKDSITMIKTTVLGLVIALSAYLVVKAIIFGLVDPNVLRGGRLFDIFNQGGI